MREIMFSILVVSLNAGEKLAETIRSIFEQEYTDYEVVVKDGGSKDDSLERLEAYLEQCEETQRARIRIIREPDNSIYEGMNQATGYAEGRFYYFLNCGDVFAHTTALRAVAEAIEKNEAESRKHLIYYGNIFDALRQQVVSSNPKIDDFACYRNVPCHQACIFDRSLWNDGGFKTEYRIRADYEFFLRSFYTGNIRPFYTGCVIADYEGGGYSESRENRRRDKKEHLEIANRYIGKKKVLRYRMLMVVTLQPLRKWIAQDSPFSGIYDRVKKELYRR